MSATPQLILASASPRRAELLRQLGVEFEVCAQDVPECCAPGEAAQDYVGRVALAKVRAGWQATGATHGLPVLGADTEVIVDGQVLGKPRDAADAVAMLARLAGREHSVCSAVVLLDGDRSLQRQVTTRVRFAALAPAQIQAYVATGEPQGKAGGYAIQGRAAAFVEHLAGSYSGVVGLPLHETAALLHAFGISWLRA